MLELGMSNGTDQGYEEYAAQSFRESSVYSLFPELRKGILHRTSIGGYKGIGESGFIEPNKGQLPYSYPQSKFYYGPSMGYVCLFDFESADEKDCILIHHTWAQFFSDHKPATIVLRLNRKALAGDLIPNSAAPKLGSKEYRAKIPYIEVWYPRPIPVSAIDGYIVVVGGSRSEGVLFEEFPKEKIQEFDETLKMIEGIWRSDIQNLEETSGKRAT
jgi:hypothetical protein